MPDPDDRLRQDPKVYPINGVTGGRRLPGQIPEGTVGTKSQQHPAERNAKMSS